METHTNNIEGDAIKSAVDLLKKAKHAVAFTGAGISTPSGIPDFRSPNSGLWEHSDPFKVASIGVFKNNPKDIFDWIRPLAINSESALPNAAHYCLAELENLGIIKSIITQNIDGLHQKAGARNVIELHGTTRTATCSSCGAKHDREDFFKALIKEGGFPGCRKCNSILKPDIVLFGESLPQASWNNAYQQSIMADVFLVIGSSLEVSPANSLPELAVTNRSKLVINNLGTTYLDHAADILLRMDVEQGIGQMRKYF